MNPTVDEVMDILAGEMDAGSALRIEPDQREVLNQRFRGSFESKLAHAGGWERDGAAVRNAARQVGAIATSIALVQQKTTVTRAALDVAIAVVQEQCQLGFQEGQWCMP